MIFGATMRLGTRGILLLVLVGGLLIWSGRGEAARLGAASLASADALRSEGALQLQLEIHSHAALDRALHATGALAEPSGEDAVSDLRVKPSFRPPRVEATQVPEPGSGALLASGLLSLAAAARGIRARRRA